MHTMDSDLTLSNYTLYDELESTTSLATASHSGWNVCIYACCLLVTSFYLCRALPQILTGHFSSQSKQLASKVEHPYVSTMEQLSGVVLKVVAVPSSPSRQISEHMSIWVQGPRPNEEKHTRLRGGRRMKQAQCLLLQRLSNHDLVKFSHLWRSSLFNVKPCMYFGRRLYATHLLLTIAQ